MVVAYAVQIAVGRKQREQAPVAKCPGNETGVVVQNASLVFCMPTEHRVQHADVQHRRRDPRQAVPAPQQDGVSIVPLALAESGL